MTQIVVIGNDNREGVAFLDFVCKMYPEIQLFEYQKQLLLSIPTLINAPSRSMCLLNNIQPEVESPSIDDVKRRIKYSKNPLEIRQLNKQLTILYKERKNYGKH